MLFFRGSSSSIVVLQTLDIRTSSRLHAGSAPPAGGCWGGRSPPHLQKSSSSSSSSNSSSSSTSSSSFEGSFKGGLKGGVKGVVEEW